MAPVDSLIMEDEHLDTIPATESDEVIKSSVENLVQIPSEFEGIPDKMCNVPFRDNSPPLDISKDQFEGFSDFNDDSTSIDDDSLSIDDIDYVEASPPDSELVSLEEVKDFHTEDGEIEDDILHEKLSKINLLIAKIEAINSNPPPPSSDFMTNSGTTTTRSNYSLSNYEAFYLDDDHIEEKSSDNTTTYADFSRYDSFIFDLSIDSFPPADRSDFYHEEFANELPQIISPSEYDCFYFKSEPDPGELTSIVDSGIRENVLSTTNVNLPFEDDQSPLLAFVVWIFLPFLTYPVTPPYLLSCGNEDTIFDPGTGYSLKHKNEECLKIIESKSKVRQSRNKAVVAKMSTSSSTPAISSDVAELKDMVRALILDRKNQTPASAPVKAVEQSCVTCGGGHFYQNCPATNSNIYHDNIQEYVSQAAAANFNQANSGYRPPMVSNQIRPPGFPPIQNPHANSQNNFNRGNNFNQNRGNNFNQGQIYRPPVNQPVAHQGPAPQTHGVSKTDFERYVTANDAVLRNMQNQGQNLQSQMANLTDMLSKFVTANTASTSGSGTLPGNTVTNPKEDLKGITTRSGVTIQGPKAVSHDTEVTKDTMPPANNGSTEDVQPPVVQIQSRNPNPEPNVSPVDTPIPKASIPFPSRRNDERRKEKANEQIEKFYEIFKDMNFEISFWMLKWISTKDRKPAKMIKLSMDMEKDCAQNQAKVKNVKKSESIMKNQEYKPVAGTEENTIECNLLPFLMRKA
ncbi:hypothetical protein Tco_1499954 [Tanacetum coccineum]